MKKKFIAAITCAATMALSLLCVQQLHAQTLCTPTPASMPDVVTGLSCTNVDPHFGINSTYVDFRPGCPACVYKTRLQGWAYTDKITNTATLFAYDGYSSNILNTWPCDAQSPDIIIGNDITDPTGGSYIIAVAYTYLNDAYLKLYHISGLGGVWTTTTNTYQFSTGGVTSNIRIDGLADYSRFWPVGASAPYALPLIDQFAIAYEQAGNIDVYSASLSSPLSGTTPFSISLDPNDHFPDVALTATKITGSGIHNKALVSMINASTNQVKYAELDLATGVATVPHAVGGAMVPIRKARIAAIDDYSKTSAGIFKNWMITYDDQNDNVWETDANSSTVPSLVSCSANGGGGYPEIKVGPSTNYTIGYEEDMAGPSYNFVVEQFGYQLAGGLTSINQVATTKVQTNAISLTAVDNNNDIFGAQAEEIVATWEWNNTDLIEKISTLPFAFRTAGVNQVSVDNESIYPNPAISQITLTTNGLAGNSTYAISDMVGRELLRGTVQQDKQVIDISSLSSGMYILSTYKNGVLSNTHKFVAQ